MIFAHTLVNESSYDHALCLAITNSHFWAVGKKSISAFITNREATADYWAGHRIVCIGDHADELSADSGIGQLDFGVEGEHWRATQLFYAWSRSEGRYMPDWCYEDGEEYYREEAQAFVPLTRPSELPVSPSHEEHAKYDPVGETPGFKPWLRPFDRGIQGRSNGGQSSEWVLRNLTKREYTREDDRPYGSFEHRVIVRAHLGYNRSSPKPGEPFHGPWAGDRFDIVPLGDLELVREKDGRIERVDGWKDVTDELSRETRALYNAELVSVFRTGCVPVR